MRERCDVAIRQHSLQKLSLGAMEFHDVLHGHIRFNDGDELSALLSDLINSPEINRLRNMRQMNFDVPLIQELGRSRRLPHSIGVAYIALKQAEKSGLSHSQSKTLLAAAMLHDAAIPPYGHLVESEFKSIRADFKHDMGLGQRDFRKFHAAR